MHDYQCLTGKIPQEPQDRRKKKMHSKTCVKTAKIRKNNKGGNMGIKFTVNKKDIIDVLSKIQGLTGYKSSLAITETVLIRSCDAGIKITVTDLETGLECIYPAVIETEGTIAINARKFYEIVKEFPVDEININEVENNWIEISNENVKYNIVSMDPSDFPDIPNIEEIDFFNVDSASLKMMIDKSLIINGNTGDSRAHMRGILLEVNGDDGVIRMISTDGGRLTRFDFIYDIDSNSPGDIRAIVPKKGLKEVSKFLSGNGDVQIGVKNNNLAIKKDKEVFIIRLLEGDFPNCEDILKLKGDTISLNKKQFLMMLKRMSILSSEDYKGATFNFSDKRLAIITINPDIGESKEEMSIEFKGDLITAAFNPKFIIEILNAIEEDIVNINIIDYKSPCLIYGEKGKNFFSVIMPMSIN